MPVQPQVLLVQPGLALEPLTPPVCLLMSPRRSEPLLRHLVRFLDLLEPLAALAHEVVVNDPHS